MIPHVEAAWEGRFRRTVSRSHEGRYMLQLPLKQKAVTNLADNRSSALRRFHIVENRLFCNPELGHEYQDFMSEYI